MLGENFYDLNKNLYYNSTCSVRIGDFRTLPFQYARGIRRGCILSPLLFKPSIKVMIHFILLKIFYRIFLFYLRESSFNITRGEEDIEGGSEKFWTPKRGAPKI